VTPGGLENLALNFLGIVVRFDEVRELVQRRLDVLVELHVGQLVALEVVVVGVVGPAGPLASALDPIEGFLDGPLGRVLVDVALAAGDLLAQLWVVGHPQHRGEGVGDADALVVDLVDQERVDAFGERSFGVVGVDIAEVDPFEAVELVDELVEPLDREVLGLRGVGREEVPQHLGLDQLQHVRDQHHVALRGGEGLAVEREPLVDHRHRRLDVHHVQRDVDAAGPGPLGVVLAERLEVDAQMIPLGDPLEAPGELTLAEADLALVAAALDGAVARLHVGTAVRDGAGLDVDAGHRLGDLAALLADRVERVVGVVDLVLVLREDIASALGVREQIGDGVVEFAPLVELGVRDDVHRNVELLGDARDQRREVLAVGLTAAEGIGDVGVGASEVLPERAGVHVAQIDDLAVEIGELPGELPKRIAVVGGEHLPDLATALAEHLGDEVAQHDLVRVAQMRDARRRDAALDDDRISRITRFDTICYPIGPENVAVARPLVGVALPENVGVVLRRDAVVGAVVRGVLTAAGHSSVRVAVRAHNSLSAQ